MQFQDTALPSKAIITSFAHNKCFSEARLYLVHSYRPSTFGPGTVRSGSDPEVQKSMDEVQFEIH